MKSAELEVVLVPGVTRPERGTGTMLATVPPTWPKYERVPVSPVVSLHSALTSPFRARPFDPRGYADGRCYLMQCAPMRVLAGCAPRLATDAWRHEGGVRMRLLLTDVDATGKSEPGFDIAAWWAAQGEALAVFVAMYPGAFIACSRGGLRIYQVLADEFVIDSLDRADEWKARYTGWCNGLSVYPWADAKVDGSCKDWSRLQRIPHDTRAGVLQMLPTIGDPAEVGTVELPAPAPRRAPRGLRPYAGPTVEVRVARALLERVAALLPRAGDGVHESAMALGGVLSASQWSTDDCVEVIEAIFATAGLVREDIGRSARTSLDNARTGGRAYGWPRLKAMLKGERADINAACNAMQHSIPGLSRPKGT